MRLSIGYSARRYKKCILAIMNVSSKWSALLITGIYAVLAVYGISFHEPWRDELQAWQIAAASGSIPELINNCRYEGHPMLWHMLLFFVKFIYPQPMAMQVVHVLISITTVWLISKYSPFSIWQKLLLPLGYTLLFEYTLISRCYNTGFLMVVIFCILHQQNKNFTWPKSLVLGLLANTSVYGLTISLFLSVFNLAENRYQIKKHIPQLVLFAVLALVSALQIKPEPDNSYQAGLESFKQGEFYKASLLKIGDAYTNLYNFNIYPLWDLQFNYKFSPAAVLLFGAVTVVCMYVFSRLLMGNKPVLFFYLSATAGIFLLNILAERFPPRQTGHYFIILITALWIAELGLKSSKKTASSLFTLLLAVQAMAGLAYYHADRQKPFSNAKQTALFIKQHQLDSLPVSGAIEFTLSPFAALLNKPVYFIERYEAGSFIRWDNKRGRMVDSLNVNNTLSQMTNKGGKVLMIVNTSYKETIDHMISAKQLKAIQIAAFTGSMVYDEDYYLYLAMNHKH